MKKKISLFIVTLLLIIGIIPGQVFATNDAIKITIDGKLQSYDQPPVAINGRTMVPLRGIFEALGATVSWDGATNTAFALKDNKLISLTINSKTATIKEEETEKKVALDQPAQIINGRTMVPLRFVSEALGAEVDWDGATRTVKITTGKKAATTSSKNATVDSLKTIIAEMTSPSVKMTDATYKLLAENSQSFFGKDRHKNALDGKYNLVNSKDIKKNPSKYINTIIGINNVGVISIQESTLEDGNTLTIALGKADGGTDYIPDDIYYQLFYLGSTDISKGDTHTEVHGILVGETTKEFTTIYGGKFTAPVYIIVAGDFYSAWDSYLISLEKGKQEGVKLTDEGMSAIYGSNLYQASYYGLLEDVERLLWRWEQYGSFSGHDPNSPDESGNYPILYAAAQGHTEIVKALLKAGADPHVSYEGYTALDYAEYYGYTEMAKILKEAIKK